MSNIETVVESVDVIIDSVDVIIDAYVASWNETDPGKRKSALAASCATDARYRDPVMVSDGHSGLDAMLAGVQAKFPGFVLKRISKVDSHNDAVRFAWSLGPASGLKGLLIGTAFGAILPGGPFTAYPVASALLAVGADFGATIAMVVSWTLIGYGRAIAWELPIMGAEFTLWRIVISLPLPILAGALGRFVYVRLYPKSAP